MTIYYLHLKTVWGGWESVSGWLLCISPVASMGESRRDTRTVGSVFPLSHYSGFLFYEEMLGSILGVI